MEGALRQESGAPGSGANTPRAHWPGVGGGVGRALGTGSMTLVFTSVGEDWVADPLSAASTDSESR